MDSASKYLSMDRPERSNHLWRYTPWRRVHPTGKVTEIPGVSQCHSWSFDDGWIGDPLRNQTCQGGRRGS